jgi:ABC-2 type transport system permease protein
MSNSTPTTPSSPGGGLRRYLGIYAALWKNSVAREMGFKSNFLLWIIVEVLWFGLQLSFISVLYLHTDHIGTWTKWQVVMLIGTSNFIQQITSVQISLWKMSEKGLRLWWDEGEK